MFAKKAEALAAAEMVGRLLVHYALSMNEINVREQRCVQIEVPIGGKQRRPIDGCVTAIVSRPPQQISTG